MDDEERQGGVGVANRTDQNAASRGPQSHPDPTDQEALRQFLGELDASSRQSNLSEEQIERLERLKIVTDYLIKQQEAARSGQEGSGLRSYLSMKEINPQTYGFTNRAYEQKLARLNSLIQAGTIDEEFIRSDIRYFDDIAKDINDPDHDRALQVANDLTTFLRQVVALQRAEESARQAEQYIGANEQYQERTVGATGLKPADLLKIGSEGRRNRERLFNDALAEVDATPTKQFDQVFTVLNPPYERYMWLKRMLLTVAEKGQWQGIPRDLSPAAREQLKKEARLDVDRFERELVVRRSLHDAMQVFYLPSIKADNVFEYVNGFSSHDGEYAMKMTGVQEMMDLYEQGLREAMLANDGYLRPEDFLGEIKTEIVGGQTQYSYFGESPVDKRVKDRYRDLYRRKKIRIVDSNGKELLIGGDEYLTNAEVDKIFGIARGMMVTSLRILSIASEARIAPQGLYTSNVLQDVLQGYSSYLQHIIGKYGIGGKGLSIFLHSREAEKGFIKGFHKLARFGQKKKWLNAMLGNADDLLYNDDETKYPPDLYIRNQNPDRAGDVFTWISWRAGDIDSPDKLSMTRRFIQQGRRVFTDREGRMQEGTMLQAFREKFGERLPENFNFTTLSLPVEGVDYTKPDPNNPGNQIKLSDEEIFVDNAVRAAFGELGETQRVKAREEMNRYFNELGAWVGTGLRFELLRGRLEDLGSHDHGKLHAAHAAEATAHALIQRMVELQPHRLYQKSRKLRKRLSSLGMSNDDVQDGLEGLQLAEKALFDDRNNLLKKGKSFDGHDGEFVQSDKVQLQDYFDKITEEIENVREDLFGEPSDTPEQKSAKKQEAIDNAKRKKELAKKLWSAVQQDFAINKQAYWDEWITYRPYNHGYIPWTGDMPVNEFNVAALGPTAGFARRGRDNQAQGKAISAEMGMLTSMKHNATAEEVLSTLAGIYNEIAGYDSGKAATAVAEKMEGVIELCRGHWTTNLPIIGQTIKSAGHGSLARSLWGPGAPLWTKTEINFFIEQAAHKELISHDDMHRLMEKYASNEILASNEVTLMGLQFAIIALALYMAQQLAKEEAK
ncbi:MAG TPA: hypothetical protein VGT05_04975 [Patescibacteria group bacterium]|nr:hypothetical protein [Patescibacteria group bacterium]